MPSFPTKTGRDRIRFGSVRGRAQESTLLDFSTLCNNCYYMKPTELTVARIGNSRGVRLPATTLKKYGIGSTVLMQERAEGILLCPRGPAMEKLSWLETARAMASTHEGWGDWDRTAADGLETAPWTPIAAQKVAESPARYTARRPKKSRT
jgi:antitoxin component of MazEF toxin-antitoxin module